MYVLLVINLNFMGKSATRTPSADGFFGDGFQVETGYTFGAPVELVVSGVAGNSLVADLVRASDAEVKPLPRHFFVISDGDHFTLRYSGPDLGQKALRELVGRVIPEVTIN